MGSVTTLIQDKINHAIKIPTGRYPLIIHPPF